MITIEGINQATEQIKNYMGNIKQTISQGIILVGDKVMQDLKMKFPDLTITSQFYPDNMEYWFVITRLGEEMTWIKCPVSNLSFTRKRDEGKQEFKSDVPELEIEELTKNISEELSLQINTLLGGLK